MSFPDQASFFINQNRVNIYREYITLWLGWFMVFNPIFNNISVIWWQTLVVIGTNCTGSCKSNYNTITTTWPIHRLHINSIFRLYIKKGLLYTSIYIKLWHNRLYICYIFTSLPYILVECQISHEQIFLSDPHKHQLDTTSISHLFPVNVKQIIY